MSHTSCFAKKPKSNEVTQAYIRSALFSLGVIYALWVQANYMTLIALLSVWILGVLSIPLAYYLCTPRKPKTWRHIYRISTLSFDIACLGLCINQMGSNGLIFYMIFLWINIGSGLRYGFWYSLLASALTTVVLILLFLYNPWTKGELWIPFLAVSVMVTCIPVYFAILGFGREQRLKQLKQHSKQLEKVALFDELTTIYNRKAFTLYFEEHLKSAPKNQPSALLVLDIDFFKKYNDQYGHLQGDECLKHFAQLLQLCFGHDGIVARYGGEEFIVLLYDNKQSFAERVQRFHAALNKQAIPHIKSPDYGIITTSIGAVLIDNRNRKDLSLEQAFEYADKALYQAKDQGRNQTIWYRHAQQTAHTTSQGKNILVLI